MSKYNSLKDLADYQNDTEKLATLRHEMIMPIATMRGYSRLLKEQIISEEDLTSESTVWIEKVIEAGDSLKEILEAVTGKIDA